MGCTCTINSEKPVLQFNLNSMSPPFNIFLPTALALLLFHYFLFASLPPSNFYIQRISWVPRMSLVKPPTNAAICLHLVTILMGNLIENWSIFLWDERSKNYSPKYFPNFSHQESQKIFLLPWDWTSSIKSQILFLLEQICYSLIFSGGKCIQFWQKFLKIFKPTSGCSLWD